MAPEPDGPWLMKLTDSAVAAGSSVPRKCSATALLSRGLFGAAVTATFPCPGPGAQRHDEGGADERPEDPSARDIDVIGERPEERHPGLALADVPEQVRYEAEHGSGGGARQRRLAPQIASSTSTVAMLWVYGRPPWWGEKPWPR